jgi:hypothetical protein
MVVASIFCKKVIGRLIPMFFTGKTYRKHALFSLENQGFRRFYSQKNRTLFTFECFSSLSAPLRLFRRPQALPKPQFYRQARKY